MSEELVYDIKNAAKKLKISKKKLIEYLINEKYIYKHNISERLKPYKTYTRDESYYFIETTEIDKNNKKKTIIFLTENFMEILKEKVKNIKGIK